jgi:hypothetical protein
LPHRNLQPLIAAIEQEKKAPSDQHRLFMGLLAQMYAFEHAQGDAPSVDTFLLWIAAVEKRHQQRS